MGFSLKKLVKAALSAFGLGESRQIDSVISTFFAPDGRHRLFIYLRKNGTYGFQEEYFSEAHLEMRWRPVKEFQSKDYDSRQEAMKAARAEVPWAADLPD